VHLPQFVFFYLYTLGLEPPSVGMRDSKSEYEEKLSFIYMLNMKIHGYAQGTRPVVCVLGSEGLVPVTRG
jgi:hypothetical protein